MLPLDPIDLQIESNVNYYISLVSFTILVHEYCITFSSEVERYWGSSRFHWTSLFFYLNRYLTLFGHIPVMVEFFWSEPNSPTKRKTSVIPLKFLRISASSLLIDIISCHMLQSYHQYFAILVQILVSILLIMRMYALYNKSRAILVLFICVSIGVVAVGCWAILAGKMQARPVDVMLTVGCTTSLTKYEAIRLAAAWGGLLVFDVLVFGLTLYKAFTIRPVRGLTLLIVLIRDGSIYFGVMVASNLANIMTFLWGGPIVRGVATTFTNIISSVTITRLMLNLRDPELQASVNQKSTTGIYSHYLSTVVMPNDAHQLIPSDAGSHTQIYRGIDSNSRIDAIELIPIKVPSRS